MGQTVISSRDQLSQHPKASTSVAVNCHFTNIYMDSGHLNTSLPVSSMVTLLTEHIYDHSD